MNIIKTTLSDYDKIVLINKLRKREFRSETGCTIVEGYPEVKRALKAGVKIERLFICSELVSEDLSDFNKDIITEVSKETFAQMAFGARLKGIIAVCRPPILMLKELRLKKDPFIVVVESVEKPGNLGTVIRSSDGAGVDAIIICDPKTDVYNHNVIRSSIGTVFHVPTVSASTSETIQFLKENNIKIYSATGHAQENYTNVSYIKGCAIVVGNEHSGLSDQWLGETSQMIKIPMVGESKSLNVAVCASVLIFEALRQRSKKSN